MSSSKTIKLKTPIDVDGVKLDTLTMREPLVSDQLAMDGITGGDAAKEMGMFANLCTVAPDDIKKLTLRDYRQLQKAFQGFLD